MQCLRENPLEPALHISLHIPHNFSLRPRIRRLVCARRYCIAQALLRLLPQLRLRRFLCRQNSVLVRLGFERVFRQPRQGVERVESQLAGEELGDPREIWYRRAFFIRIFCLWTAEGNLRKRSHSRTRRALGYPYVTSSLGDEVAGLARTGQRTRIPVRGLAPTNPYLCVIAVSSTGGRDLISRQGCDSNEAGALLIKILP